MTLAEQQRLFTRCVAELITWANQQPKMAVRLREVARGDVQARFNAETGAGILRSLHLLSLAVDLVLDVDGVYQRDSAPYAPLGAYWKTLHPLARWGGDFERPDGGHFSLMRGGVR